ncbi:MAG: mannose-1-phosphate guanyltransferase [Candidatus Melainabacteria bacterium]|nr:MAG: mannose-1-phosphate guanyltransferase [Candidatus Melainabacteria bacterium]
MDNMKALILAAGAGTRLAPLTNELPKPLMPVANRAVMSHILRLLEKHNVKQCIANLHHLADQIPAYFSQAHNSDLLLSYKYEPELTGDAGGMRACKSFLQGGTFVVMMGDILTDMDLSMVIHQHKAKRALATIALKRTDEVERFGIAALDNENYIVQFQEKPKREEALSDLGSTGCYVFEPEIFHYVSCQGSYGFGRDLFPNLIHLGLPVLGVEVDCYWSDIGTICQYMQSSFDVLDGQIDIDIDGTRDSFGWCGSNASMDTNCRINGKLLLGKNSRIEANVSINGYAVIGDNCTIGAGSKIYNSIIWSGNFVACNSSIANSIVYGSERVHILKSSAQLLAQNLSTAGSCRSSCNNSIDRPMEYA